jgi:ABC-type ATPase with predicted acetyltransferase domain
MGTPFTWQLSLTEQPMELWRCGKCGRELVQDSRPHRPPKCCGGVGMWWISYVERAEVPHA